MVGIRYMRLNKLRILTPKEVGTDVFHQFDGKEIKPGIFVIGDVRYYEFPYQDKQSSPQLTLPYIDGSWRCLANVDGMLCVIEVSLFPIKENAKS